MPFDGNARIETWRKQLLDTTKRNRLINFKAGRGAASAWSTLTLANSGTGSSRAALPSPLSGNANWWTFRPTRRNLLRMDCPFSPMEQTVTTTHRSRWLIIVCVIAKDSI